jgi:hypothetical protein
MAIEMPMKKPIKKKKLQVKPIAHVKTETVASFPHVPSVPDLDLDK